MKEATPAKLRDGSWGARVKGTAKVGDEIEIVTKSGKSWTATVTAVLWNKVRKSNMDLNLTLVATDSKQSAKRSSSDDDWVNRGPRGWEGDDDDLLSCRSWAKKNALR